MGLWFVPRDGQTFHTMRSRLVATLVAGFAAVAIGRALSLLLPFRLRPMHDATLKFVMPYGGEVERLSGWNSLPSDHAVLCFALVSGLWSVNRRIGILLALYVLFVVGFTRVYAGLHYPSDILIGAVCGAAIASLSQWAPLRTALLSTGRGLRDAMEAAVLQRAPRRHARSVSDAVGPAWLGSAHSRPRAPLVFDMMTNGNGLAALAFRLFPWLGILAAAYLLATPATWDFGKWLIAENHPIEMLTFASLFVAAGVSLHVAYLDHRAHRDRRVVWLFVVFGLGAFGSAMEEIAWGQWFVHFGTPEVFKHWNAQGETTLHNLRGLQGHTEFLRIMFGAGGLVAVAMCDRPRWRDVGAPSALGWWFAAIVAYAVVDLVEDYVPIEAPYDYAIRRSSEMTELVIGIAALLYVLWHWRRRRLEGPDSPSTSLQS